MSSHYKGPASIRIISPLEGEKASPDPRAAPEIDGEAREGFRIGANIAESLRSSLVADASPSAR